jgi:vitamin B12 transporter
MRLREVLLVALVQVTLGVWGAVAAEPGAESGGGSGGESGAGRGGGSPVRASETVVSASRVPLPRREVGSAVTVIEAEQIEQRQTRVVSDLLRDVPGVAVSRDGPVGSLTQVRIRGAEGNQTLVVVDGIEVNNPAGESEFDFANLLNTDIERVEVLRGPQSAVWGSDALGGVVNVVTQRPRQGLSVRGRAEAGSFATRDALLGVGYADERFYLSGTAHGFRTRGVSDADARAGNSESDGYRNHSMRLKSGFEASENFELEAVGMLINADRQFDASVPVVGAVDSEDTSATAQRYARGQAKLTVLDGRWEHFARASYTGQDNDFFDSTGARTFASEGRKSKIDYQSNAYLATPDFLDARHTLTFVAERERERQRNAGFGVSDKRTITNRGYVGEYRVDLARQAFLSGAVRYDDNDPLFENETTYRATGAWLHQGSGTRLHASYGRGVKNPTLFQLFGFTPTFVGNPDLRAERSIGWDVGVEVPLIGDRALLDVTYFNNRIGDLIQGGGNTAVNLPGTSRIDGVEVAASAALGRGLSVDASYTFTDGQDATGTRLVRRPRHLASVSGNYRFALAGGTTNVNLTLRYNGEKDDLVFDNAQTRRVTLDDYTLLNLAVSWEAREGIEIYARGENLLDQDYQDVFGFGTPGIAGYGGVRIVYGR